MREYQLPHNDFFEKATKKLESAEYLFNGGYYDDAASRAYYAMYYAARSILALKEISSMAFVVPKDLVIFSTSIIFSLFSLFWFFL